MGSPNTSYRSVLLFQPFASDFGRIIRPGARRSEWRPAEGSFFSSSFWPPHAVKHKPICLSRRKNEAEKFQIPLPQEWSRALRGSPEFHFVERLVLELKVETHEVGAVRLETPTSSHRSQSCHLLMTSHKQEHFLLLRVWFNQSALGSSWGGGARSQAITERQEVKPIGRLLAATKHFCQTSGLRDTRRFPLLFCFLC